MNSRTLIYISILLFFCSGCSSIGETAKVIIGNSTRTLEESKDTADSRTYRCTFDECFDALLSLARNEKKYSPNTEKYYDVFMKSRVKGHVVVMGVPGNVDTTEVGIFLTNQTRRTVVIDVVSLSSIAQHKVSKVVFEELDTRFSTR